MLVAVSSSWTAAVTRSATAAGVGASSLSSRCKHARPWTSDQIAVASCLGVTVRKASLDDLANVQRYGCGRGNALVVVPVTGLAERYSEQGGSLERELHVGGRHARQLLRGRRRRVRRRQALGELVIADSRDR
jgi:hypothetical protein